MLIFLMPCNIYSCSFFFAGTAAEWNRRVDSQKLGTRALRQPEDALGSEGSDVFFQIAVWWCCT